MNTKFSRSVLVATAGMGMSYSISVGAAEPGADNEVEEVVVTGTFIRGIAPVGSTVIGISEQEIQSSGVNDSNQVLSTLVPQSNFFMELQQPANGIAQGVARVPIDRPQLRNVGNPFNNSGSTTLVMMDGHRIVTAGLEQAGVDVGLIPPGMIARQEIILDGVSALYGSDAVAGVINYITRKRFDGMQVNVQYGVAEDYDATSANATFGKSWESGGIGLTYSFGENSSLYNGDRPYAITRNYLEGGRLTGLACEGYSHDSVGTGAALRRFVVTAGQTTFIEQTNWCESNAFATLSPAQERHAAFLTLSQDLTDVVKFDMSAFYSTRETTQDFGPFTTTATVRSTSPYFRSLSAFGIPNTTPQSVQFSYGPVLGTTGSNAETTVDVGQVAPTISVGLGNWEARGNLVYGRSKTELHQAALDTTLQASYLNSTNIATAINPYDIAATQNLSLLYNLVYDSVKTGIQELYQAQVIADGPVFSIPGGDVRLAVGGEWNETTFSRRTTDPVTRVLSGYSDASSSEVAVFAELNAPLVGPENRKPGIHSLTLSASARWDEYQDYGDTFNPKIGLTYEPVEWLAFHGSWGTSFRAPNAVDKLGSTGATLRCFGNAPLPGCSTFTFDLPPGYVQPPGNNVYLYLAGGTVPDLEPETSESWSAGVELRPSPGLTLTGTYYVIDFTDKIEIPPTSFLQTYLYFPDTLQIDPTAEQIAAFAALSPLTGANVLSVLSTGGYYTVYTRDGRTQNLGSVEVEGVDLAVRYDHATSFGSVDASISGTYQLKNETKISEIAPVNDTLETNTSRLALTLGVGANIGDFRAQATFQHRSGYDLDPSTTRVPEQTSVDAFDLVNVSFRYEVNGNSSLMRDLTLTLTVNNVLDDEPPILLTTTSTTVNGSTLGRLVQFGINKEF